MNRKFTTSVEYNLPLDNNSYMYNNDTYIPSPQYSDSPYENESISEQSKKIRKKRHTYQKIEDNARIKLLEAVQDGETLKAAAKKYNINYSSAKSILHTFRKEGRILKKSAQERTARKRVKASHDIELSPIYLTKFVNDDDENENQVYQTYHSPETTHKSGNSPNHEDDGPKTGYKTLAINTFGGFLKVDQSFQRPENLNVKVPASTLTLKLDSCGKASESSYKNQNLQGKNWQLSVNVHNENTRKPTCTTEPLNLPDEFPQYNSYSSVLQNKLKSFKMNSSSSPIPRLPNPASRNESRGFVKDFDAFSDMLACNNEKASTEPHNFDVSNFLCNSPSLFYQKRISDGNPFHSYDYFGFSESLHNLNYEPAKRMSSDINKQLFEEISGNGNVITTGAGLQ